MGKDVEKWNLMTHVREEAYFTKGRVIVRGKTVKRGEAKKADYLLYYRPNIPLMGNCGYTQETAEAAILLFLNTGP